MDIKGNVAIIAKNEPVDLDELEKHQVDQVEIELIRPIEVGGDIREHLIFEEPTGRQIEAMSKAGSAKAQTEVSFRILGECVELSPDEVKNLRSRDLVRLGTVLKYFLPDSPHGLM